VGKFCFFLFYLKEIELCAKNQVFVFVEHVLITKYIVKPIKAKNRTAHVPCHVTWGRWLETTTYLESPPKICLLTIQHLGAPVTIKGSLLMSLPIIKRFWSKIVPPKSGLKIHFLGFRGENF